MEERILSGKYRIQREIVSGGMGMVYHTIDLTLKRDGAIKVLHEKYGGDPACDKRFPQEARGLARLDHPKIIRIYAVEQDEGIHCSKQSTTFNSSASLAVEAFGRSGPFPAGVRLSEGLKVQLVMWPKAMRRTSPPKRIVFREWELG